MQKDIPINMSFILGSTRKFSVKQSTGKSNSISQQKRTLIGSLDATHTLYSGLEVFFLMEKL